MLFESGIPYAIQHQFHPFSVRYLGGKFCALPAAEEKRKEKGASENLYLSKRLAIVRSEIAYRSNKQNPNLCFRM